ncbi:hypothetical protein BAUCODRAFT_317163 [Baudoinia panamericana UAMH 10762]|uniref:Uncharacterized protein n=1 Tax=Baudoinia panamericana (strain UAMH 10762) TaxID=717646 RepID=M2MIS3_BAUPA|nr:uncharacterized protein BAUCODRAFT_317163 [Baudoinia panamericana UAMH 10762]EMC91168.1 hypothetical protein BAUCODRAFT_317163 [Baudoinia panamericana UAMH 10762]
MRGTTECQPHVLMLRSLLHPSKFQQLIRDVHPQDQEVVQQSSKFIAMFRYCECSYVRHHCRFLTTSEPPDRGNVPDSPPGYCVTFSLPPELSPHPTRLVAMDQHYAKQRNRQSAKAIAFFRVGVLG